MKRSWLLGLVGAALMAAALPAMGAATLAATGEITYGITGNGTAFADAFSNAYVNFALTIDPNNTVLLELFANKLPTILTANGGYGLEQIATPLFYLQSNIGGVLGLDPKALDPILYGGFGNATTPGYGVTDYGIEDIAALGIGGEASGMNAAEGAPYPYIALNTGILGMANVLLGVSSTAFGPTNNQAVVGAYGTVGPVSLEASYSMNASVPGPANGTLAAGALVNYKMGGIAVNGTAQVVYSLAAASSSKPLWSAGVSTSYQGSYGGGFSLVSFYPADAPTGAVKATANVDLTFAKTFGVNIATMLNFDPNAGSVFDTLDASAWTTFGAAKVRVGYLYGATTANNLGTPALNAPTNNGGLGGIYVSTDVTF